MHESIKTTMNKALEVKIFFIRMWLIFLCFVTVAFTILTYVQKAIKSTDESTDETKISVPIEL